MPCVTAFCFELDRHLVSIDWKNGTAPIVFDEGAAEAGLIRVRGNVENYAVAEGEEGE